MKGYIKTKKGGQSIYSTLVVVVGVVVTILSCVVEETIHSGWQERSVGVHHDVVAVWFDVDESRSITADGRRSGRSVASQMIADNMLLLLLLLAVGRRGQRRRADHTRRRRRVTTLRRQQKVTRVVFTIAH